MKLPLAAKNFQGHTTDIVTGSATAPSELAGVDFNLFEPSMGDKKQLGLSVFAEIGRYAVSTQYSDFL